MNRIVVNMHCVIKQVFNTRYFHDYLKCINAFMNTEGGTLWFGVNHVGIPTGINLTVALDREIKETFDDLQKKIFPTFNGKIEVIPVRYNSMMLVKVVVTRETGPHSIYYTYYGGRAFLRLNMSATQFGSTQFVQMSHLEFAKSQIAELQAQLNNDPPSEIEQHLIENGGVRSIAGLKIKAKQYSEMPPEELVLMIARDHYFQELKQTIRDRVDELSKKDDLIEKLQHIIKLESEKHA